MTGMPSCESSEGVVRPAGGLGLRMLWGIALVLVAFVMVWPVAAGLAVGSDERYYAQAIHLKGLGWQSMVDFWNFRHFRPIDVLGFGLVDLVSLDARWAVILHVPAFLALLGAVWVALRRLTPYYMVAFPIAVGWLTLHTATSVSLWSVATISQTWSAALGCWLGVFLWQAVQDTLTTGTLRGRVWVIVLTCGVGVWIKEIFHGWAAAGCVVLATVYIFARLRDPAIRLRPFLLLILILLLVPLLQVYVRWAYGGLGKVFAEGSGRYTFHIGMSFVRNLLISGMGYFAAGPVHYMTAPRLSVWARSLPFLSIFFAVSISVLPWLLVRWRMASWPHAPSGRRVLLIALMTFLGVSSCLPFGHISELYLMGPNAGAAVLVSLGFVGLWQMTGWAQRDQSQRHFGFGRRLALAGIAVLTMTLGIWGLFSRAHHARISWYYSKTVHKAVLDHQMALPVSDHVAKIYLPKSCTEGWKHSRYVWFPALAIDPDRTMGWLNQWHPDKQIEFVLGEPQGGTVDWRDLVLDCSKLPPHPNW